MLKIAFETRLNRTFFRLGCIAAIMIVSATAAQAANCGGNNQRACKVWERVPSCNKGLSEVSRPGFCTKPKPIVVIPKPPKCGASGQRPCTVVERIPSCNSGLVEDPFRNQCVKKATGAAEVAKACFKTYSNLTRAMLPVAACVSNMRNPDHIARTIKGKDAKAAAEALLFGSCRREVENAARAMRRNGFASMSVGVGGDVGVVLGAISEFFVAINTDLKGRVHLYETLGFRMGSVVGGGVDGVVTAFRDPAHALAGDGQGLSVSLKALGGGGGSIGLSFAKGNQPPACVSLTAAGGPGAKVNAGSLNRFMTLKLR